VWPATLFSTSVGLQCLRPREGWEACALSEVSDLSVSTKKLGIPVALFTPDALLGADDVKLSTFSSLQFVCQLQRYDGSKEPAAGPGLRIAGVCPEFKRPRPAGCGTGCAAAQAAFGQSQNSTTSFLQQAQVAAGEPLRSEMSSPACSDSFLLCSHAGATDSNCCVWTSHLYYT